MTRKQAQRRKKKATRRIAVPKIPLRGAFVLLGALAIVAICYRMSAALLDKPIDSITVEGPFQRVTALQIEAAISDRLDGGFFSADLAAIRNAIVALPWIDDASVARRWPGTLAIAVTEQVPAATWGERGLLNTRGELFVSNVRHVPAELPRLSGPDGRSAEVAERYLKLRDRLMPTGLDLREVALDARGAWLLKLSNGIDVRLGRRDVDTRAELFLDVAASIIASREAEIEFVDMRYSNGFTIGWKNGDRAPVTEAIAAGDGMVARVPQ